MWKTAYENKYGPIKEGDIVIYGDHKHEREVRVMEVHEAAILVKPTDGKVFYRRNDGVDIMQAWWGYEMIYPKME